MPPSLTVGLRVSGGAERGVDPSLGGVRVTGWTLLISPTETPASAAASAPPSDEAGSMRMRRRTVLCSPFSEALREGDCRESPDIAPIDCDLGPIGLLAWRQAGV